MMLLRLQTIDSFPYFIALLRSSQRFWLIDCNLSCLLWFIHQNQYGFIRNRTIEECIAWALQYVHMCHQSRKEIIILKFDFEKAFDRVEHEYMLKVMKANGFPQKWLQWMRLIFASRTSAVLLNGLPKRSKTGGPPLTTPVCARSRFSTYYC